MRNRSALVDATTIFLAAALLEDEVGSNDMLLVNADEDVEDAMKAEDVEKEAEVKPELDEGNESEMLELAKAQKLCANRSAVARSEGQLL